MNSGSYQLIRIYPDTKEIKIDHESGVVYITKGEPVKLSDKYKVKVMRL